MIESTGKQTAAGSTNVLLLPWLSGSLHRRFYWELVDGRTLLQRYVEWWRSKLLGYRLLIAFREQTLLAEAAPVLGPDETVGVALTCACGDLAALRDMARQLGTSQIALLPFTLPLLPTDWLPRLWHKHEESGVDLTLPAGLPEHADFVVLRAAALDKLVELGAPGLERDFVGTLRGLRDNSFLANLPADFLSVDFSVRFDEEYALTPAECPGAIPIKTRPHLSLFCRFSDESMRLETTRQQLDNLTAYKRTRVNAMEVEYRSLRPARVTASSPPLRVLYVSNPSAYSGSEEALCRMIARLDRATAEPHALVALEGFFTERLRQEGVQVLCPEQSFGSGSLLEIHYLQGVLDQVRPDVIHINGHSGFTVTLATAFWNAPVVLHLRSADFTPLGEALYVADRIIAVSPYMAHLLGRTDVSPEKVVIVYDGIDVSRFAPGVIARQEPRQRFGFASADFVVLMVARFVPNKRHMLVLEAFRRILPAVPSARLALVGEPSASPDCLDALRAFVAAHGIQHRVDFIGFQEDIRWIEAAADLHLLASEKEPLGTGILESMALGVPVVIARGGGGLESVVRHEETGLVVRPDADGFAEAILRLHNEPALARQLALAARRQIVDEFSDQSCARRMTAIYQSLSTGGAQAQPAGATPLGRRLPASNTAHSRR